MNHLINGIAGSEFIEAIGAHAKIPGTCIESNFSLEDHKQSQTVELPVQNFCESFHVRFEVGYHLVFSHVSAPSDGSRNASSHWSAVSRL